MTNKKVRLLARPCGTPTGMAWAIGETIGFTNGFTSESLRIVLDLREIGANAGVRAGIALMRLPRFAEQRADELTLRESFQQFQLRLLALNHESITEAKACRTPE